MKSFVSLHRSTHRGAALVQLARRARAGQRPRRPRRAHLCDRELARSPAWSAAAGTEHGPPATAPHHARAAGPAPAGPLSLTRVSVHASCPRAHRHEPPRHDRGGHQRAGRGQPRVILSYSWRQARASAGQAPRDGDQVARRPDCARRRAVRDCGRAVQIRDRARAHVCTIAAFLSRINDSDAADTSATRRAPSSDRSTPVLAQASQDRSFEQ